MLWLQHKSSTNHIYHVLLLAYQPTGQNKIVHPPYLCNQQSEEIFVWEKLNKNMVSVQLP